MIGTALRDACDVVFECISVIDLVHARLVERTSINLKVHLQCAIENESRGIWL